jgi:hypothetical protein
VKIVPGGINMTQIPDRSLDGYGSGIQKSVPDGRCTSVRFLKRKGRRCTKNMATGRFEAFRPGIKE